MYPLSFSLFPQLLLNDRNLYNYGENAQEVGQKFLMLGLRDSEAATINMVDG